MTKNKMPRQRGAIASARETVVLDKKLKNLKGHLVARNIRVVLTPVLRNNEIKAAFLAGRIKFQALTY